MRESRCRLRSCFGRPTRPGLEALYALAIHTGLRQGELLGLKWEDVDLEDGSLQVRRTLATTKSGPVFTFPKTTGSRWSVKLTGKAIEVLKSHLERQLAKIDRVACGAPATLTALYSPPRSGSRSAGAP